MKQLALKFSIIIMSLFISSFLYSQVEYVDVSGKFKENGNVLLPSGAIIMWSGNTVPDGWVLCDGNNATPNLIDRFILGSLPANVNETGGSDYHIHSVNPPPAVSTLSGNHDHGLQTVGMGTTEFVSIGFTNGNHSHNVMIASFDSASADSRPAFYRLVFIMKT